MPPSGYLSSNGVEAALVYLANTYPTITQLIALPNLSVEGRTSRAIMIANGVGGDRKGVLLIGGVHARELVNPDLLVNLALRLCDAFVNNSAIVYGGATWSAGTIKLLVDSLDIFIWPLVNPDGRKYVQDPTGYAMWRKNRSFNAGSSCRGVDINRNYDFLWPSGIGTSSSPCSDTYKGPSAFSEPETQNVRWFLDTYANIISFVDVHSYSELILYPWGDDDNQTVDSSQNFQNPAWDGLRGNIGTGYAEYIPPDDQAQYIDIGNSVRDAIADVRGRVYTVQESSGLYPTSGTSEDYAYSRRFVAPIDRKIVSYVIETGQEFQPPVTEAAEIVKEVSSGLIAFMTSVLCFVEKAVAQTGVMVSLSAMRRFRDKELLTKPIGRHWLAKLEQHTVELLLIAQKEPALFARAGALLEEYGQLAESLDTDDPRKLSEELHKTTLQLVAEFEKAASNELSRTLAEASAHFKVFKGKTLRQGLAAVSRNQRRRPPRTT